jgi:hypothetical protein
MCVRFVRDLTSLLGWSLLVVSGPLAAFPVFMGLASGTSISQLLEDAAYDPFNVGWILLFGQLGGLTFLAAANGLRSSTFVSGAGVSAVMLAGVVVAALLGIVLG